MLRAAIDLLRQRLPAPWTLEPPTAPAAKADPAVDAELRLRAPDGAEVTLPIEAKRLLNTRDVPIALEALQRAASRWGSGDEVVLVLAARYLAPATRERIVAAGAGYVDLTGNVQLAAERPALLIRDRGADRDPWRGPGRPRGTLKGPPAARVVRALIDFAPPYTVPELAERAGASTGATYRVVDFLEEQGLLERQRYAPISDVRWRPLLERWSRDYGFAQSNTVATFLEPRGLSALTDRLASRPQLDYVLTGSLAAERVAAYAPARLATLYVRDIAAASELLDLRLTESGANIALWPAATTTSSSSAPRRSTACGSRQSARWLSICSPARVATPAKRLRCSTGWQPMSPPGDADILVAARAALLDALDALRDQRDALVLIGAQAIYLHHRRRAGRAGRGDQGQ